MSENTVAEPAPIPVPAPTGPRDFTKKRRPISFTIDDDTFHAVSAIPAQVLIDFAGRFSSMDPSNISVQDQLAAFHEVLVLALQPESYALFNKRMSDPLNPIEMDQIEDVINYLFEQHGLRPTQLSSNSPDGLPSPESGTGSTANTPGVELISANSPSTVS